MKKILGIVGVVVAVGVVWYLAGSLVFDQEVNEQLPFEDITEAEYEEMKQAFTELGIQNIKKDELEQMTAEEAEALEREMDAKAKEMPEKEVDDEMPTGPAVLARGEFRNADDFHYGSGTATIYKLADGSQVLRLENFEVTNGPDLRVLLAKNNDPKNAGEVQAGYVELGSLKGNIGNQNYEIPVEINIDDYGSVVIYCKPFHVVFAVAPLK